MLRRALERLWVLQGLTCREATRLAAHAMDRPLTLRERLKLSLHNLLCSYCRNYSRQLRLLRKWVRHANGRNADSPEPLIPAASAFRIKKKLESEISRAK